MKPAMGVFVIRSKASAKCYLEANHNVNAKINGTKFQLDAGLHPVIELQKEWKELGEEQFDIDVLETLEYDKEGTNSFTAR